MKITPSTTLQTLTEQYGAEYLLPGGQHFSAENRTMTLQQLHEKNPTWSVTDMEKGLERLETEPKPTCFPLGQTAVPNLIELRAQQKTTGAFVILLAGGAYGAVCTLCESLPAAAELNALGVDCYCLNYRTATQESFVSGLMPKPLDDLAAAVRFIQQLRSKAEDYYVVGFSAGGHLASLWGTAALGAPKYGLPLPKGLLLGYPLISLTHIPEPLNSYFRKGLFGASVESETADLYNAAGQMTQAYPPFYLVRAADDTTVSPQDGEDMETAARRCKVPHKMETASAGGHGFGPGTGTPLEGWLKRGMAFLDTTQDTAAK